MDYIEVYLNYLNGNLSLFDEQITAMKKSEILEYIEIVQGTYGIKRFQTIAMLRNRLERIGA